MITKNIGIHTQKDTLAGTRLLVLTHTHTHTHTHNSLILKLKKKGLRTSTEYWTICNLQTIVSRSLLLSSRESHLCPQNPRGATKLRLGKPKSAKSKSSDLVGDLIWVVFVSERHLRDLFGGQIHLVIGGRGHGCCCILTGYYTVDFCKLFFDSLTKESS